MKPSRVRAAGGSTGRLDAQSWDLQTRTDSELPPRRYDRAEVEGVPPRVESGRAKKGATRAFGVTRAAVAARADGPLPSVFGWPGVRPGVVNRGALTCGSPVRGGRLPRGPGRAAGITRGYPGQRRVSLG